MKILNLDVRHENEFISDDAYAIAVRRQWLKYNKQLSVNLNYGLNNTDNLVLNSKINHLMYVKNNIEQFTYNPPQIPYVDLEILSFELSKTGNLVHNISVTLNKVPSLPNLSGHISYQFEDEDLKDYTPYSTAIPITASDIILTGTTFILKLPLSLHLHYGRILKMSIFLTEEISQEYFSSDYAYAQASLETPAPGGIGGIEYTVTDNIITGIICACDLTASQMASVTLSYADKDGVTGTQTFSPFTFILNTALSSNLVIKSEGYFELAFEIVDIEGAIYSHVMTYEYGAAPINSSGSLTGTLIGNLLQSITNTYVQTEALIDSVKLEFYAENNSRGEILEDLEGFVHGSTLLYFNELDVPILTLGGDTIMALITTDINGYSDVQYTTLVYTEPATIGDETLIYGFIEDNPFESAIFNNIIADLTRWHTEELDESGYMSLSNTPSSDRYFFMMHKTTAVPTINAVKFSQWGKLDVEGGTLDADLVCNPTKTFLNGDQEFIFYSSKQVVPADTTIEILKDSSQLMLYAKKQSETAGAPYTLTNMAQFTPVIVTANSFIIDWAINNTDYNYISFAVVQPNEIIKYQYILFLGWQTITDEYTLEVTRKNGLTFNLYKRLNTIGLIGQVEYSNQAL